MFWEVRFEAIKVYPVELDQLKEDDRVMLKDGRIVDVEEGRLIKDEKK